MPSPEKSSGTPGATTLAPLEIFRGEESLPLDRCLQIFRLMVRTRTLEERMIKMSKSGEGYFWIGGPGEEAFNTCLGLLTRKGCGPSFDYLHLHYRNSATLMAMGLPMVDAIRQMAMTVTDPNSRGRNFPGHFARREWNVIPVTSVIGVQWVRAPGTAWVQRRQGGEGISIVVGGDAGTHEGDFQSCMVWSTLPGRELPLLMIVMNNGWGISTSSCTVHAEERIIDRGRPYGIPGMLVDGNDPIASWHALSKAMTICRRERRPYLIEARVSRLYGHSSSSGALRVKNEPDCLDSFESLLMAQGALDSDTAERIHKDAEAEAEEALEQAMKEPRPLPEDVEKGTYAASPVDAVYPGDYTGIP